MTGEFAIGVHALVFLNHKKGVHSSEEIAVNVCTNPARVRKVLAKLKKHGLVETKEGIDGGYLFNRDSSQVTLAAVADAVDAVIVAAAWKSGSSDMDCLIASGMAGIMDGIYGSLDQCCKEKLKNITIADIDRKIFAEVWDADTESGHQKQIV